LCLGAQETANHLCKDCPFTTEVRRLVCHWTGVAAAPSAPFGSLDEWWDASLPRADKVSRRRTSGNLIYVWWNVWKERNRRIFTFARLTYVEVAHLAFEEINQCSLAFSTSAVGFALEPD
ncbi:hypothetical protein BRADI_4g17095v3, partial [Brachypodium distachyon]